MLTSLNRRVSMQILIVLMASTSICNGNTIKESVCEAVSVINKTGRYLIKKDSPQAENLRLTRIDIPSRDIVILGDRLFKRNGGGKGFKGYTRTSTKGEKMSITIKDDEKGVENMSLGGTIGGNEVHIFYKCKEKK